MERRDFVDTKTQLSILDSVIQFANAGILCLFRRFCCNDIGRNKDVECGCDKHVYCQSRSSVFNIITNAIQCNTVSRTSDAGLENSRVKKVDEEKRLLINHRQIFKTRLQLNTSFPFTPPPRRLKISNNDLQRRQVTRLAAI